ncbi:ADP-ribose diphosphatase [Vibrio sp. RC27]
MRHIKKQWREFTSQDVKIVKKELLFQGFFKMIKYHFVHKRYEGGESRVVQRELFVRGRAAALLPYDPITDQVVLIEQIRAGSLEHANPWQIEIVAGVVDKEAESAEELVRREAVEEAGVDVGRIEPITAFYPSSGGCDEVVDIFVGEVDASSAQGIHGLLEEDEDIKVMVLSREDAYQLVKDGTIENGASIIALQWLEINQKELKAKWLK